MDNQTQSQSTQATTVIPEEVKVYLEGLLADASVTPIDEQMKEDMLVDLYQRLDNFLTAIILENLPPQHLEDFIKMNKSGKSREETEKFITSALPNADEVFANAFLEFRDLYLGNTLAVANAPKSKSN